MRILIAVSIFMISTSVFAQRSRVRENVKQQAYISSGKDLNKKIDIEGVEVSPETASNQKKRNMRRKSK